MQLQLAGDAPWKQRFRAPNIDWAQIAELAPSRGLAATNQSGKYQLYAWDLPSGELRPLTSRDTGLRSGALSPDGRHVYYLDDKQGNEIGHLVRVPWEGGPAEDVTPNLPLYSARVSTNSLAANRIGLTVADAHGFHVYLIDLSEGGALGDPRLLFESPKLLFGPILLAAGDLAAIITTERSPMHHYNGVIFDALSGARVAELWDGEGTSVVIARFSPVDGDARLLAVSNRTGVKRPLIWNPRTGERLDLRLPQLDGEVLPEAWSRDGRRLLLCQVSEAVQRLHLYDLPSGTLTRLAHPGGSFQAFGGPSAHFAPSGELYTQWQDASHPNRFIALDATSGAQTRTVLAAGEAPAGHPWRSVSFSSSDGQRIQAWLGTPDGPGPFPTILYTHGGPETVSMEQFHPASQAWIDHGFAFLSVNYRGSTTFGKEFQEQIWGDPGHWEIEDIVAAREWLVREGIARADAIFPSGWSYGGYNTLMALGKYPDLWAGGMAGIAIADWTLVYEDEADMLRGMQIALFGGKPEEKAEQYARSSPITYADRVQAPVLIIQGRNDTRTPARQVEAYEAKLKALGKRVTVHWFDAGHLGAGVEQDIRNQELMLRFACDVLEGRA